MYQRELNNNVQGDISDIHRICPCMVARPMTIDSHGDDPFGTIPPSTMTFSWWWLLLSAATAWMPPHPDFVEYESAFDYRKRLNITYNYKPKHLPEEHCKFLPEEICERDDKHRGLLKEKRRLNPSIGM